MIGLEIIVWVAAAASRAVDRAVSTQRQRRGGPAHPTPSAAHWLGIDHLGRDILSRILWGARTVLTVAPMAVVGATLLGSILGLMAGYYRGRIDLLIARVCDIVLSFPVIILYMIILACFGASALNIIACSR